MGDVITSMIIRIHGMVNATHMEAIGSVERDRTSKRCWSSSICDNNDRRASPLQWHTIRCFRQRVSIHPLIYVQYISQKYNISSHLLAKHAYEIEDSIVLFG